MIPILLLGVDRCNHTNCYNWWQLRAVLLFWREGVVPTHYCNSFLFPWSLSRAKLCGAQMRWDLNLSLSSLPLKVIHQTGIEKCEQKPGPAVFCRTCGIFKRNTTWKREENNEYGAGMQSCLVNFGGVLLAGSARGCPIALASSQSIPQKAFCLRKWKWK